MNPLFRFNRFKIHYLTSKKYLKIEIHFLSLTTNVLIQFIFFLALNNFKLAMRDFDKLIQYNNAYMFNLLNTSL